MKKYLSSSLLCGALILSSLPAYSMGCPPIPITTENVRQEGEIWRLRISVAQGSTISYEWLSSPFNLRGGLNGIKAIVPLTEKENAQLACRYDIEMKNEDIPKISVLLHFAGVLGLEPQNMNGHEAQKIYDKLANDESVTFSDPRTKLQWTVMKTFFVPKKGITVTGGTIFGNTIVHPTGKVGKARLTNQYEFNPTQGDPYLMILEAKFTNF